MMHVLHVITTINRGGAENHLFDLVRAQVALGLTVTVAYLKGDGYWASSMGDLGVSVAPLGLRFYGDLAPLCKLRRLINITKPDIVHAHMPPAELYTCLALLLIQPVPILVISKHNDERFFVGLGQRFVGRWVLTRAKRVISISNAVYRHVEANLRPRPHQVVTVYYGIDPRPYQAITKQVISDVRTSWGVPEGTHVIGTVTRFVPQKSLHVLLKAYANFRAGAVRDSRLVLVGRGPLEEGLRQLAANLGIENSVVWAGFREDIQAVMGAFDCFALTSKYEGFGRVLLEAMAAGRPVVATAVSAIPEVVADGVTGILCPAGDVESVAAAFSRLTEPALHASFGEAGKQRVERSFSIESMLGKTMSIYLECL